jgi:phosphate transport system substrate-binding protein
MKTSAAKLFASLFASHCGLETALSRPHQEGCTRVRWLAGLRTWSSAVGLRSALLLGAGALVGHLAASELSITGSSTIAPLMTEIARAYEASHPGIRIDVQAGGSSRGLADVRSQRSQLGMVSRRLKADESDVTAVTIAIDGITCISHAGNPLAGCTRDQLLQIYTGKISNWSQVGGADLPLVVVNKAEGTATLELFTHFLGLKSSQIVSSVIIGDNAQGIKTVAVTPGAIGYVSIGAAQTAVADGIAIKLLKLDGITPSSATVLDGTWAMTRPLNLIFLGKPADEVSKLVDYAHSPAVDGLIKDLSFVPLPR